MYIVLVIIKEYGKVSWYGPMRMVSPGVRFFGQPEVQNAFSVKLIATLPSERFLHYNRHPVKRNREK